MPGGTSCVDCQPGFFSHNNASKVCDSCRQGFRQPLGLKSECLVCERGKFSETASRVCTDIPDSVDVDSPRIVQAEVIFSRQTAVDGIPLRTDAPANVRQIRVTVEEPVPGTGSVGQYKGLPVAPIRTVVWWAQREDFTDKQEVGRIDAAGYNSETEIVHRKSTTLER